MSLRMDSRGLESLPLKLMIVSVVASLSIIPAAQALENMRTKDFINRIELQLDRIVSSAELLAINGPGGVTTVELDFSSQSRLSFDCLMIGDRDGGPNMSSVVLRFSNRAVMIESSSDPPVWFRTEDARSLIVDAPRFDLRMSAQIDGRTEFILVEAV